MAVIRTTVALLVVSLTFVSGILVGQTERFELEGNMKLIGPTSGIIFPDGSKQTSAGVGSSNDVVCVGCVGTTDLADNAISSTQVALNSLTADDLGPDSVGLSEIGTNAVGPDEIAPDAVGASEIVADAVGAAEIFANAVGSSEIATDAVGSAEIAAGAVGTSEVGSKVLKLSNMNMTVFMNYSLNITSTTINNGACSTFIGNAASGVAAGSWVLVFGARPSSGAATGWVVEGEDSPTGGTDVVKVRVCNYTGANGNPPVLRFNFWTIAP